MHDFLQPYLNDVVNAVVGLLFAVLVAAVIELRKKVVSFITSHTSTSQRTLLHVLSGEAVAYAATVFKEQNGEQKLENALSYVNKHLPFGITVTEAELRGAVEKAYAAYKAQEPTATNTTVQVQSQPDSRKVADAIAQALKTQGNL